MKKQSGFSLVEGLLIILILSLLGFAGYTVWTRQRNKDNSSATTQPNTTERIPAGYAEYSNPEFGFSFVYPENWGQVVFTSSGAEIGFKGGGGIEFSEAPSNNGSYEIGPFQAKTYQEEEDVPVFLSATETANNLSERLLTTSDGGKYRYELISDNSNSHIFAYCYYGIGVNLSAKMGDNVLNFLLNFDGYQSGSSKSHECAKTDNRKLSEIISQEDLVIAKTILESIRQN